MKKQHSIGKVILYIVLTIFAGLTLYPFLWMLSASFKPLKEIVGGQMSLYSPNMSFDNYIYIFGRTTKFPRWFLNSFIIATVGTTINIFVNTMAGYSLSRLNYPGRNKIFFILMSLMMIPAQVLLIPNYLILHNLHMLDKYSALIVPSMANIGNIIMMRQFFINFPRDVEEAASIDGLSRYGRFFRICMPLSKPIISTQAVFIFMGFWNEFTKAMLYIKTETKYTLTLGLQTFSSRDAGTMWHQVMAAATITVLPIVVIYFIFNRYFLVGVRMDGEK